MTPLDALLGTRASAILVLAVMAVLLLAAAAATLDVMGGSSRVLQPLAFQRPRAISLRSAGLPCAVILLIGGGALGAVVSGSPDSGAGTTALLWLTNGAFLACVLICGLCSPMARHWGLGLCGFAVGLGLIFPLLRLISALGFDDDGLLRGPGDRLVFGLAVGTILLCVALAGAAILSMATYTFERTFSLVLERHDTRGRG